MRLTYMLGTALFIGLVFYTLKQKVEITLIGLFAYHAVLGLYGEIGRKKIVFPLVGLAGCLIFLGFNFFGNNYPQFQENQIVYFGLALAFIWDGYLFLQWRN